MKLLMRALAALALCTWFVPASFAAETTAAGPSASPDVESEDSLRADIVARAYASLATLSRAAGSDLSFELSDVRTLSWSDLEAAATSSTALGHRWSDIVTMPGGAMIDMSRRESVVDGRTRIGYDATWRTDDRPWPGQEMGDPPVANVLGLAGQQRPDLQQITAVTTYQVHVTLRGEQRTYRAAMLWFPPETGHGLTPTDAGRVQVLDFITQGVGEALTDVQDQDTSTDVAPGPGHDINLAPIEGGGGDPGDGGGTGGGGTTPPVCTASFVTKDVDARRFAFEGHTSNNGEHGSYAVFHLSCTCETDCTSRCDSNSIESRCKDFGDTFTCHLASIPSRQGTQGIRVGAAGLTQGAQCAAGAGCVVNICTLPFCLCAVPKVRVKVVGFEVGFDIEGTASWNGNLTLDEGQCAPCTAAGTRPPRKKKARKVCQCPTGLAASTLCTIEPTCEDAAEGEPGYETCEQAIAAAPDPDCGDGPQCGNGRCEPGEGCLTCPFDCGLCGPRCGNGFCEFGESCSSCPFDCGSCAPQCGNGVCEFGESSSTCCTDCGCQPGYTCDGLGPFSHCTCTTLITEECGTFTDQCGHFHDKGPCPAGEICVGNYCQTSGGGGGGGGGDGGGGGGCCDSDGDGWVTGSECTGCCGGRIEGGFCVLDFAQSNMFEGPPSPNATIMRVKPSEGVDGPAKLSAPSSSDVQKTPGPSSQP
jgi:hypothetical protein